MEEVQSVSFCFQKPLALSLRTRTQLESLERWKGNELRSNSNQIRHIHTMQSRISAFSKSSSSSSSSPKPVTPPPIVTDGNDDELIVWEKTQHQYVTPISKELQTRKGILFFFFVLGFEVFGCQEKVFHFFRYFVSGFASIKRIRKRVL
ncbi:unnamed protein product [Malus baccata var. baccata]